VSTDQEPARVLVTGGGGQLASYLAQQLPAHSTVALARAELDITDAGSVERAFAAHAPAVVINTAAFNHVDQGESEFVHAFRVNAQGPLNLARACAAADATLVHVSTDYVFGGQSARTPLPEDALPAPLSVYGASKLAGEHLVRGAAPRHLIVRTCGLYGRAARRSRAATLSAPCCGWRGKAATCALSTISTARRHSRGTLRRPSSI